MHGQSDTWHVGDDIDVGGVSRIWKVTRENDKIVYAAKLARNTSSVKSVVYHNESIDIEVNILRDLDHPGIIKIISEFSVLNDKSNRLVPLHLSDADNVMRVMIMPYYSDGSLAMRHIIGNRRPFAEIECKEIGRQMLSVLQYLKSLEIVHCDVKPGNILQTDSNTYKLCDFGFASKVSQLEDVDCGTPYYVAPETLMGMPCSYASDLWSLAVSLFLLLVGVQPFDGYDVSRVNTLIKALNYAFPKNTEVSDMARAFIVAIICPVENRMTVETALCHPWLL